MALRTSSSRQRRSATLSYTIACLIGLFILLSLLLDGSPFEGDSWGSLAKRFHENFIAQARYTMVLRGLFNTLIMTTASTALGLLIGLALSLIRLMEVEFKRKTVLGILANAYVTVIRGTPIMVQLMIWAFSVFGSVRDVNLMLLAILAFGVNSGAYVAEIFRSGFESIDRGQLEAARSLGLSYVQSLRLVLWPQALKRSLPVLINEFISLLKETSIAGYIAVEELTRSVQNIQSITVESSQPLLMAAFLYLAIVLCMTSLMGKVEQRMKRYA